MSLRGGTLLLVLLLLASCAKRGMPPGGPEDTFPPIIVDTKPASNDLNVPRDSRVEIIFDERIKPESIADAVFITPFPGDRVSLKLSGRRLIIRFADSLFSDRTYVITLGTGVKDLRNNPLRSSFTLAFSTGDHLDQGEISGRVWGEKDASGIGVWAFMVREGQEVDPSRRQPDYVVQCDKEGRFHFIHLAPARYRLCAVQDRVADRYYQPVEDRIGLTNDDIRLSFTHGLKRKDVRFRLTRADTSGPKLVGAVAKDRRTFLLSFDEPVTYPYAKLAGCVRISYSDSLFLPVQKVYIDKQRAQQMTVHSEDQEPNRNYTIVLRDLEDRAGNRLDPEHASLTVEGTADPDTSAPRLIFSSPAAGARHVLPNANPEFIFSEAVLIDTINPAIIMHDTLAGMIPGKLSHPSPAELLFQPLSPLPGNQVIEVELHGAHIRDTWGNEAADSLFRFHTVNPDTLSAIGGEVRDADSLAQGPILIRARQIGKEINTYKRWIKNTGTYYISDMLPGLYILEAFRDEDGNGRYSYGSIFPFRPAERFTVLPDTVKIRARWPNEGNDLELK